MIAVLVATMLLAALVVSLYLRRPPNQQQPIIYLEG